MTRQTYTDIEHLVQECVEILRWFQNPQLGADHLYLKMSGQSVPCHNNQEWTDIERLAKECAEALRWFPNPRVGAAHLYFKITQQLRQKKGETHDLTEVVSEHLNKLGFSEGERAEHPPQSLFARIRCAYQIISHPVSVSHALWLLVIFRK